MTLEAPAAAPAADTPALAADLSPVPVAAPADATYGWEMFVAFVAAVLGISIVVAVLALVGSWWMLGIAMIVHVGITATMMRLVYGAFGSEAHQYPDGHTAEAVSRAAIFGVPAASASQPQLAV